ncbi:MAG: outer membrane lipoprotein carrier protein LolA [Deltaproteobacteria bacterium]|nr:MAG: outer membrane lipoprotein carrier protein LolA [Deltaproteobacteria bacterium]
MFRSPLHAILPRLAATLCVASLALPATAQGPAEPPRTLLAGSPFASLLPASLRAPTTPAPTAERDTPDLRIAEAPGEQEERVGTIVAAIQATYERVDDFQANFTQEFHNPTLGETRTSEGRVFFRKPGMMRWDYQTPTERFLISDGQTLWVYEPEFDQYYTQSLADSQLPTALRFLMGEGDLRRDFEITLREERNGTAVLDLVPRESEAQVRRLRFTVHLESATVTETVVVDPLGNTNRLRFRQVRQNAGLPSSGFSFSPPSGTTRITAPQ